MKAELDRTSIAELMLRSASDSRHFDVTGDECHPLIFGWKVSLADQFSNQKALSRQFLPAYVTFPLKHRRSLYSTKG